MHADAMPEADRSLLADPGAGRGANGADLRSRGAAPERIAARSAAGSRARRELARSRGLAGRGRRARAAPGREPGARSLPRRTRLATCRVAAAAARPAGPERRGHAAGIARRLRPRAGRSRCGWRGRRATKGSGPRCSSAPGSWRERTEDRRPPPRLERGGPHPIRGARAGVRARGRGRLGVEPVAAARRAPLRSRRRARSGVRSSGSAGRCSTRTCADRSPLWHVQTAFAGRPLRRGDAVGGPRASCAAAARAPEEGRRDRDGHARRRPLVHGRPGARRGAAAAGASLIPEPHGRGGRGGAGPRAAASSPSARPSCARSKAPVAEGRLRPGANRTDLRIGPASARASSRVCSPVCTSRERATSSCCRPSRRGRCSSPRSRTRDARATWATSSATPA